MKSVLVTGSAGQLGNSLRDISDHYKGLRFTWIDIADLDITNEAAVSEFIKASKPEVIINCAAYTAVDKAEQEKEKAFLINAEAVQNLASLSKSFGIFLVHISTDYVFNGRGNKPYSETDEPDPISVYAQSKHQGEVNIIRSGCRAMIVRTSWLYSEYGSNFLKTIKRLAGEREELKVVSDQTGTPTYAGDLAKAILDIIANYPFPDKPEIYHYSNEGIISWYEFAKAIVEESRLKCRVLPIPTTDYPLPAARPMYSAMSKEKIKKTFGIAVPSWDVSLKICMGNMISGK
ncbi:MAG: dTDP-4-dehydrorhamnose reductase [Bacteroidetes bacterium]|nr:dTDP-4-dehydrorhamnose reductase [Bacteroidota bacterium]